MKQTEREMVALLSRAEVRLVELSRLCRRADLHQHADAHDRAVEEFAVFARRIRDRAKRRHLLSREQGGADVPPPGPRNVEDLLCHVDGCGLQIQERRVGPLGSWVWECPIHGETYAESVPGGADGG